MQCRYKEKLIIAGDWIFGAVYPTWRESGKRRGRFRETSEMQKKLNERHALEMLTWTIHANFDSASVVFSPTYSDGCYPEDEAQFNRDVRNFIGRVARLYKRAGKEFKYIVIRAYGEEHGRLHLHFIFSGGVDYAAIRAAWKMGRCNYKQLEFDECGVVDLSRYLFDQRHVGARRWSGSRNLVKPIERTNVHTYTKAEVTAIAECGNPHKHFADKYEGYCLSEFPEIEKNPINAGVYMTFTMYKPDSKHLAHYARREGRRTGRRKK